MLATGGTTLDASHQTGTYLGETAWGLPYGTPGTALNIWDTTGQTAPSP